MSTARLLSRVSENPAPRTTNLRDLNFVGDNQRQVESCPPHHDSILPYRFLKDKPLKVNGKAFP